MKVLIVGGGIAGPALALFLHRAGITSTVFEARDDADAVGGGLSLAPNGMNVLDALSLANAAQAAGTPALENCFRGEDGHLLARYDNGSCHYGRPAVNLRRADLHQLLVAEMRRIGCEFVTGARLTAVKASAESVTLAFDDGGSATGDVLVGADGIHSRVRAQVFPEAPAPHYVGIVAVGGFVSRSDTTILRDSTPTSLNFTFGRQGMFGYGGARPDELMWWCNTWRDEPASREDLLQMRADRLAAKLARTFRGYHEPVPSILATSTEVLAMNLYDLPSLPAWHHGRVVLIGDAAHAVSPNSGQGAALALEDAQCLAGLLVESAIDHRLAFATFERDRRPRAERVAREGRRRARDKKQMSPLGSALRNLILSVTLRLFGERSQDWAYRYRVEAKGRARE